MFKDVAGYEGLYAVNEMGEVWRHEKESKIGVHGGKVKRGGFTLKQYELPSGHLRVFLSKDGKKKQHQVHRLVAKTFINNPLDYTIVNHKDCNPQNNNVKNLEWCSVQQNSKHAYDNGLQKPPDQYGSKNSQSKLTETQVKEIRAKHKVIKNCSAIAREFKINPKTVNDIVNGKRWVHI